MLKLQNKTPFLRQQKKEEKENVQIASLNSEKNM
jgi:hypothetical protein